MKKVLFSGSSPTGMLTIGNYLGAIKSWLQYQDDYDSIFCIVDLHAITTPQNAAELRERTLAFFSLFIACGLDPERSTIFIQSQNPFHTEMAWVLNGYTHYGDLTRMTQFKDKALKQKIVTAGLLSYPVLMAADILLYGTAIVPVGADQKQHVELTRQIAMRFNSIHGELLAIPEPFIPATGARIRSLLDPQKKMDKSDKNPQTFISLLDPPEEVFSKIRGAKTDSMGSFPIHDDSKAISNLVTIFSEITGDSKEGIVSRYQAKGYAPFKKDLAECIVNFLAPIQERYQQIRGDKGALLKYIESGRDKAIERSQGNIMRIRDAVGIT